MKKVRVRELQEGMVVAADVFEANIGGALPFMRQGVVLNNDYINRLKNRDISFLYIEVPKGYRGAPGETLDLELVKDDIMFDGRVHVKGDILPGMKVEAGESIIIEGTVAEGCILTSAKGGVSVRGFFNGTKEKPVKVTASQNVVVQNISANYVTFADIKTSGEVNVSGDVTDSTIAARGTISVEGRVVRAQLYSQTRIRIKKSGDEGFSPCLLMVKPFECRDVTQELLKIDSLVSQLLKEKGRLQNIVDLIKKLGKDVEQLPQDKKLELASGVKRFKAIEDEIDSSLRKKADLKNEMEQLLSVRRIVVTENVFPGTKVMIENSSVEITKKENGLSFSVKDSQIVQTPYAGGF